MPLNPLTAITAAWREKLFSAGEYKWKHFGKDAEEAMRFFDGPYSWLYDLKQRGESSALIYAGDKDFPRPSFAMTVNKVSELVQLYGPALYYRNPFRQVNPRRYPGLPIELFGDPNNPDTMMNYLPLQQQIDQSRAVDKARASLMQAYLNYTPDALDLKEHGRAVIDEALIKGASVLWTETYKPAGANFQMVGSFYDTIDNLLFDPDMESFEDAKWIARRRVHPVWQVEQRFGFPSGTLTSSLQTTARSPMQADAHYQRMTSLTSDMLEYWEIWSKMGVGGRLQGVPKDTRAQLDGMGQYCYLAIAHCYEYPLNLAYAQNPQEAIQWPTPFWADDEWPCTMLGFHQKPRECWPISTIKPGMGELRAINWIYSFMVGKIRTTCRDFIVCLESASEEIKRTLMSGYDYELIQLKASQGQRQINDVVQFLQHPDFNKALWDVLMALEKSFEKRVGLNELMYGYTASQSRSATDAQAKTDATRIRPDDMAERWESVMTKVSRKEAFAARWHLDPQRDIQPILGPVAAQYWQPLLSAADPSELLHSLEYRIEAGSIRKPNREREQANMNEVMQILFQPWLQYSMTTGDFRGLNTLISRWAQTRDFDPEGLLFTPPPMPVQAQPVPQPRNGAAQGAMSGGANGRMNGAAA